MDLRIVYTVPAFSQVYTRDEIPRNFRILRIHAKWRGLGMAHPELRLDFGTPTASKLQAPYRTKIPGEVSGQAHLPLQIWLSECFGGPGVEPRSTPPSGRAVDCGGHNALVRRT